MLFETDVIDAVCGNLKAHGFTILQRLSPTEHGIDVIAKRGEPSPFELSIEAKGGTSERKGSQRYGKPFDSAQVKIHVAESFYTAAQLLSAERNHISRRVGIALPQDPLHQRYVVSVQPALTALGVGVFWVTSDKRVFLVAPWQL